MDKKDDGILKNHLLIAMPSLTEGSFAKSVVYVCAHGPSGAMGIVVNQPLPQVRFEDLTEQLQIPESEIKVTPPIHYGGPVEKGRGFVLHSLDFFREDSVKLNDKIAMTGTIDVLRAITEGNGPAKSIFALGYAGWDAGQLERELQQNAWLVMPADEELLFHTALPNKWARAMEKMGINPARLSTESGRA